MLDVRPPAAGGDVRLSCVRGIPPVRAGNLRCHCPDRTDGRERLNHMKPQNGIDYLYSVSIRGNEKKRIAVLDKYPVVKQTAKSVIIKMPWGTEQRISREALDGILSDYHTTRSLAIENKIVSSEGVVERYQQHIDSVNRQIASLRELQTASEGKG